MNKEILKSITKLFSLSLTYKGKAKGGFLSDNYILTDEKDKYFLKKYRPSVHGRLSTIVKSEDFFSNENIPIILPLKTNSGKTYFELDDDFYSLFPYVPGKTLDHKKDKPSLAVAKSIATNLAAMHIISKKSYPAISDVQLSEWDPEKVLNEESRNNFYVYANKLIKILESKKRKSDYDSAAYNLLKLKLSLAPKIPQNFKSSILGKKHIVHGDYHAQNLFLDNKGNVTHIFDLGKSDIRFRSLELTRSMFLICFNAQFNSEQFTIAKTYLKAYNSVYPIKQSEIVGAIKFMYYKNVLNLWMEKEHYLNNNRRPDPLLKGELKFLLYMSKNLDTLIKKLYT